MLNSKHDYFEVGNGSRRTLRRVPEMMDTPPIQNNCAFIILLRILFFVYGIMILQHEVVLNHKKFIKINLSNILLDTNTNM